MLAGVQVAGAPRARPQSAALVVAVLIGLVYLLHLRAWTFLCDDAFISFRYARNLGEQGALVYNLDPLEFVEGYTNFAWVLVLALGVVVGLAPEQLAPALTGLAGLVSLLAITRIGAELRLASGSESGPKPGGSQSSEPRAPAFELVDLFAPALLVTSPEFVVWGSSGLETGVALALGLGAIWAWLRGRVVTAATLAGVAGLTRPDTLLWIAGFGLGWLVVAGGRWVADGRRAGPRGTQSGGSPSSLAERVSHLPWARLAFALAVFVVLVGGQFLFRHAYYGAWLPNTWAVKHHGALLRATWGLSYLEFWVARTQLLWALPALVLLRPRHLSLAAPIAVVLVYAWSVGGDFMAYSRFLLPATALCALSLGLAWSEAWVWAANWKRLGERRSVIAAGIWGLVAVSATAASAWGIPGRIQEDRAHAHLHLDYDARGRPVPGTPGFEGVAAMDRFAAVRLAAGAELAARVPPDTWISVGAAGALPYASRLPAFDSYGLVDPGVLEVAEPIADAGRARPGHQLRAPLAYVRRRDPDLMCHIGWEATRPPTRVDARRRAGRGMAWACVETGPIVHRRAVDGPLESRYYCCLRPEDRLEHLDPRARERRP